MRALATLLLLSALHATAAAQTLKVLTAGAIKPVVVALVPGFQSRTGVRVEVINDTAGALVRRIQGGEAFDLAIVTDAGLKTLAESGHLDAAATRSIARVGIGVAVKNGLPLPPLATVDDFRAAVLGARRVAYIDPTAGGSSGIYLQGLFQRLGLDAAVRDKAVLVPGGLTALRLASGEADLAIQQASELKNQEGATFVGMLPDAIQNYTTYGWGIAAGTRMRDAAEVFAAALGGNTATQVMGMVGVTPITRP